MRNLDIALLRTLLQVADAASMTVAARRLHMTQGAVSQQVQRLEQMLGQVLLVRGKQGTQLTQQGVSLLPRMRQLVELNDAMLAELGAPGVAGQLSLGVPHDLMGTHLPPILQRFTRQFPAVEVTLMAGSSAELKSAFDAGTVDLALTEEPADTASGAVLLLESPIWVGKVGGQAWQQRPLPVCLVSATCVFRPQLAAALAAADIAWRNPIDYPSLETTVAMVQADLAVTVLLPSTMASHLTMLGDDSGLPSLPPFAITLHASKQGASAASLALANAIRAAYRTAANPELAEVAPSF